jgi:hypothetical protein
MNPGVVEPGACSSRWLFRVLGILILLTLLLRLPLLDIPFERDEGGYAYIGWRLGHHELPYRDWVDQKPPAIFWVYRFALSLPFDSIRAVHLVALVFSAAAACALFFLPGSEQSFTDWSQSYVDKYFLADSFLILDQMNTARFVTPADGRGGSLPAGQRVIGVLSLRRNGTSGGAE